ncbi:ATP-dependent helicase [Xanthomonas hortorum pv. carotae str. M081]|nr:ATP-dependent helicase [Xanthomonas hortorum pv. carotae str. M081]
MSGAQQTRGTPLQQWRAWFAQRGWAPLPFQRDVWKRYLDSESGLLHTPTGSGKTLAAFGGPLLEALAARGRKPATKPATTARRQQQRTLQVLWITPLRALAADTARALREPVEALGLDCRWACVPAMPARATSGWRAAASSMYWSPRPNRWRCCCRTRIPRRSCRRCAA